ncbi:MAG: PKD domain-containing protein [Candidatus Bathyarchaeota archaeon]
MRRLTATVTLALLFLSVCPATCGVTSVSIYPEKPVRGDALTVDLKAAPGEEVSIQIRFKKELQVSGGKYLLELRGVEVPPRPNSFTVKATNVKNLVLAVRIGIWMSVSKEAVNGVATISQSGVLQGRYDIQVKGDAATGAGKVSIEVTARTTVTVGGDGRYTISYDTSPIPAGTFNVDVGGVSRTVTLSEAGTVPPTPSLVPPVACFNTPKAVAGEAVTFDASASYDADGSITEYIWDMGDGTVLRGREVTHTYGAPGLYTVVLTVVDNIGLTGRRVELLDVAEPPNRPPVPVVTQRRSCFVGQPVGFSAHRSHDPEGRIASYRWDLGDGSTAEGVTVSHRYLSPGPHNVTLVVTDEEGLSGQADILVDVLSPPAGHTDWTELTAQGGGPLELPGQRGHITVNASDAVPILFFMYPDNPHPDEHVPPGQAGAFLDLIVGDPDLVTWPLYLELRYNANNTSDADNLCLYHYSSGWLQCRDTGAKPGAVWARLWHDELQGSPLTIGATSLIEGAAIRSLTLSSDTVRMGDEVTVSVEVVNTGDSESLFTLVLEVDQAPKALRTVHLGPGENRIVTFTLSLDTPGLHQVGIGGVTVPLTVYAVALPDLTISGVITLEATAGVSQTIPLNVSNMGEAPSEAFNVSLYIDDLKTGTTRLGPLNPGEAKDAEFTWTPDAPGAYRIRVVVDEEDAIPEADEDNNELTGTVTVSERPTEDNNQTLIISSVIAAAVAGLWLSRRPRQSSLGEASAARTAEPSNGSSITEASATTGSKAPHPTVNAVATRPQRTLRSTRTAGADARL